GRILHRFDLEADHRQPVGDAVGGGDGVEMFLEPGQGEFHCGFAPGAFAPRNIDAMEISSSISGQWSPIGISSMTFRAVGAASIRRGYHHNGADSVRPSA